MTPLRFVITCLTAFVFILAYDVININKRLRLLEQKEQEKEPK